MKKEIATLIALAVLAVWTCNQAHPPQLFTAKGPYNQTTFAANTTAYKSAVILDPGNQ